MGCVVGRGVIGGRRVCSWEGCEGGRRDVKCV